MDFPAFRQPALWQRLDGMLPYWKNINVPVAYLQGESDDIIDTSNASFARRQLVNVPWLEIHFIKNRFHRLAQFEWPAIRESILKVYDHVKK